MGGGRARESLASPVAKSFLHSSAATRRTEVERHYFQCPRRSSTLSSGTRTVFGDAQGVAVRPGAADVAPNFYWQHRLPRYYSIAMGRMKVSEAGI